MKDRLPPFPNAYVVLDVGWILWSRERRMMSTQAFGEIILQMWDDLEYGRWRKVKKLPFVHRVIKGLSTRPAISLPIRRHVRAQPCVSCGATESIEVDHIKPYSKGGTNGQSNLQPLCRPCNRSKGTKTMKEWMA